MTLFLVGRIVDDAPWEVLGIYVEEEAAVRRCHTDRDFVAPVELDRDAPEERMEWPGARFPRRTEGGA